jgi:hypothetical protein
MKTIIEGYRTEGYPQLFAEFEYFYNEMKKKRTKTLTPHKRAGQATLFPLFSFSIECAKNAIIFLKRKADFSNLNGYSHLFFALRTKLLVS